MKQYLIFLFIPLSAFSQIEISYDTSSNRTIFRAITDSSGLTRNGTLFDKNCQQRLALFVKKGQKIASFPVTGHYRYEDNRLLFQPILEPDPSLEFVINYNGQEFPYQPACIDRPAGSPPKPLRLYPPTDQITENILCFYLTFDQEMKRDDQSFKHIKLRELDSAYIEHPWRQRSFWIDEGKTLVLMVHPGRVKRDIRATSKIGPAFKAGKQYELIVTEGLKALNGTTISTDHTYAFTVLPRDETSPAFKEIKKKLPAPDTFEPLEISFTESMDYGLTAKWLEIKNDLTPVSGNWTTVDGKHWSFVPDHSWKAGDYTLVLASKLGDPAHNQPDRKFEERNLDPFLSNESKDIAFHIGK